MNGAAAWVGRPIGRILAAPPTIGLLPSALLAALKIGRLCLLHHLRQQRPRRYALASPLDKYNVCRYNKYIG